MAKKRMKKKADKKFVAIIVFGVLIVLILFVGIGILIYQEERRINSSNNSKSSKQSGEEAEKLGDGEIYDFESAGYLKLGKYKGIEADVEPAVEDIYSEMIEVAKETKIDKDGPVVNGDLVNVDFAAQKDGKKLDEASSKDEYVWIGKKDYIDDFEKGIIGIRKGKEKTFDCTFPADYDDRELAGQTVQFTVIVKEKFSDRTAKKASKDKCSTVQEYYEMEAENQRKDNRENKGELVWDQLKEETEVETAPKSLLERATEDVTKMYSNFAELSGTSVEDLLEQFNMDEDGLEEIAADTATDIMIAKTIAKKENIAMDDDYYKKALWTALGYEDGDDEKSLEEMEKEYKENMGSRPRDDMLVERVKDYVGENAKEV